MGERKEVSSPNQWRKSIRLAGWVIIVALFITGFSVSMTDGQNKSCNELSVQIDHEKGLFFIDEDDVAGTITGYCASDIKGLPLRGIGFREIEEKLESNPFVQNAEIYASPKGLIFVQVSQREPLVRVVNREGVSYYLDADGMKMPPSSKFTARVVVATGNVENADSSEVKNDLLGLCRFIAHDEFWKAQFEQIYVTETREFDLVPKLGNHIIRLGKAQDLEAKFNKLMIFYKEILKNYDSDGFRIVNLKFKDQVVCTKNSF
jgi:cell division protein FtsQ